MYTLPFPLRDNMAEFDAVCAKRDLEIQESLRRCREDISAAYDRYNFANGDHHSLTRSTYATEQEKYLEENFAYLDTGRAFDHIREDIFTATQDFLCPMCCFREASELDHFLPRSKFPEFSIFSPNLVPLCHLCNNKKGSKVGSASARFVHPYFDIFPDREILIARISITDKSVVANFDLVDEVGEDSDPFMTNLRYQFVELNLPKYFRRAGQGVMSERAFSIRAAFRKQSSYEDVHDWLELEFESTRSSRGRNHFQTALYLGLSRSEEFWKGGFERLPQGRMA